MLRIFGLFILALLPLGSIAAMPAQQTIAGVPPGGRIALIIAVTDNELVPGLLGPENDAYHVAPALEQAGFHVDLVVNPTLNEARDLLEEFKFAASEAEDALVYYTGVGIEVEGKNLLAAVDSDMDDSFRTFADYAPDWISTAELANTVRVARNQGLVFLDGGRFQPFSSSNSRGFAIEARSSGVIMLYSSGPGESAIDTNVGEDLGPFAKALAKYMQEPGLEIRSFLEYVSADVRIATDGRQNPEYEGVDSNRPFYFLRDGPLMTTDGPTPESDESVGLILGEMILVEPSPDQRSENSQEETRNTDTPLTQFIWTDQPRLALVMGVSDYNGDGDLDDDRYSSAVQQEGYAPDLANAINDARDMKDALESIRFDVTYIENPDKITISDAFFEFESKISNAGADAIVVVFYAGHAIQVSGTNYVIPASAQLPSLDFRRMTEAQIEYRLSNHAVPLNLLYERLKNPSDQGMNLIILDACRENPWETRVGRNIPGMGGESRGLADIVLQVDRTAIAYSTKPGDIAADGDGVNSPYTSALKERIVEPGLNVRDLFSKVAGDVIQSTERKQSPWLNSPYLGETCLGACYPDVG